MSCRLALSCLHCGTSFRRFKSQIKGRRQFCSAVCRDSHGRERIQCSWPGCLNSFLARQSTRRTKGREVIQWKVDFTSRGLYSRFQFCREHLDVLRHFGVRAHRVSPICADPSHEYPHRGFSRTMRFVVLERAGFACQQCRRFIDFASTSRTWTVDHIVPIFRGGRTVVDNLQALCRDCDREKTAPEKSDAARQRHALHRLNRWATHTEKDRIIESLRARIDELETELSCLRPATPASDVA